MLNIDSRKADKLILENTPTKKKTTCLFWSLKCIKFSFLVPNCSYITNLHSDIFWHLGRQDKADHRPDSGNSDSSVEPVKKRRPRSEVRRKGDRNTSSLFSVSGVE